MSKKVAYDPEAVKPRALVHKEIKQMKEAGMHPYYGKDGKKPTAEEAYEYILDNYFSEIDFDNVAQKDFIAFADDVFALTYGIQKDEIKN